MERLKRLTFAAISAPLHPLCNTTHTYYPEKVLPTSTDSELCKEILSYLQDLSPDTLKNGDGEWSWLQSTSQTHFIHSLESSSASDLSHCLSNLFINDASYGYVSPSYSDSIKAPQTTLNNILCDIDSSIEFAEIQSLEQLSTPVHAGNPFGYQLPSGRIVLPDTPRHFYYSKIIKQHFEYLPSIVEIGSGYGGMSYLNHSNYSNTPTSYNIDLLPALFTCYYFLSKLNVPVRLCSSRLDLWPIHNHINLIPSDDNNLVNHAFANSNVIFNSRSLSEMSETSITNYIKLVNSSSANYFFHENSNFLLFPNSQRHLEVLADDFNISCHTYKLIYKSISPFTGGSGRYRQYFYARI